VGVEAIGVWPIGTGCGAGALAVASGVGGEGGVTIGDRPRGGLGAAERAAEVAWGSSAGVSPEQPQFFVEQPQP
jgi:hypothetical protein